MSQLTAEEKAYFETGGQSDLPNDYANDVKVSEPPSDNDTAGDNAEQPPVIDDAGQGGDQPPAQSADDQPGDAQQPGQQKQMVPLATYMEEKKARQERRPRQEEIAANMARADERLRMIFEAQQREQAAQQAQQQAPQIPNPDEDPVGSIRWIQEQMIAQQRGQQEAHARQQHMTQEQQRQRQYQDQVVNVYRQSAEEMRAANPSFQGAYEFLMYQRAAELGASGMPQEAINQQLARDEFAFAAEAIQNRRNPAQAIMDVAKARGWNPAAAQAQGNAADQLQAIKQGQAASASLSSAGTSGNARSGKLTMESLGSMSDKEFAEFIKKDKDGDQWKKVMGG